MTDLSIRAALSQKATRLERCIQRAREAKAAAADFASDFNLQDAAILNVQRACECTIDIAYMVIARERWSLPGSAGEAFTELENRRAIDSRDAEALRHMVGFRNVSVHAYDELNLDIVAAVIDRELDTLAQFAGNMLARYES